MINLITAPPGVGKTLFAVMQLKQIHDANLKNLPAAKKYYQHNLEHLSLNADKTIFIDLVEFKGNQNLFSEIRVALEKYDQQTITLLEYFACFNHYDFSEFYSDKVTPNHYFLSTSYNLIANYANKELKTDFKMIPPVRQIYSDINGLRVDDVLESPDDWRTCPDGSVIFYDEVQNRAIYKNVKTKNDIVEELTIHRHRGFDIWFITQFPVLIHTEVRAVVGQHYHLFRPWGLPQAFVHVWSYSVVDPNSFSKKRAAERTFRFSYSKDIYKLYTSSTMHTHKVNLPKKIIFLGLVMVGGLYMTYDAVFNKGTIFNSKHKDKEAVAQAQNKTPSSTSSNTTAQVQQNQDKDLSLLCRKSENLNKPECVAWFDKFTKSGESISPVNKDGSLQTVSYNPSKPYDDLKVENNYQVVNHPKFSGCMKFRNEYRAYTEQGTYLKTSKSVCDRLMSSAGERPYDYFTSNKNQPNNFSSNTLSNSNSANLPDMTNKSDQVEPPKQVFSIANNPTFPEKDITKPTI